MLLRIRQEPEAQAGRSARLLPGSLRLEGRAVHAAPSTGQRCGHALTAATASRFVSIRLAVGPGVRSADASPKLKRYGTVPAAEHSQVERPINELRSQAKTGRQRRKR
jgi:hypothetical protein